MSWDYNLAKALKAKPKERPLFFIFEIKSKSPFVMTTLDGELTASETNGKLIETESFHNWRTTAKEVDVIGKKVLAVGEQKFAAIGVIA
jgi:hypothetical protein